MATMRFLLRLVLMTSTVIAVGSYSATAYAEDSRKTFIGRLNTVNTVASTVPTVNGDLNPYGVAVVQRSTGKLVRGNILVSNFNNSNNQQGTGSTIVEITPTGVVTVFAQIDAATLPGPCPGGVGLTTALVVLRSGFVIVGSLPTVDGTAATAQAGCLIVLDSQGQVRETLSGNGINGPWDMTASETGDRVDLFVTNVLNGTVAGNGNVVNQATVLRLSLELEEDAEHDDGPKLRRLESVTEIGSGFPARTDPVALVIGPTGVGLEHDVLYVADTVGNRIAAIPDAVKRSTSFGTGQT